MSLYAKYFTAQNQIICIVFFSYIYDLIRTGYLESKRKHLRLIRKSQSLSAYFKYNHFMSMPPLNIDTTAASEKSHSASRLAQRRKRFHDGLLQTIDEASLITCKQTSSKLSPAPARSRPETRALNLEAAPAQRDNKTSPFELAGSQPAKQKTGYEEGLKLVREEKETKEEEDDCPLKELPTFIRVYEYVSHAFVTLSFLKYLLLNLIYTEFFGLQKVYSCYIPGRTAVLPEFSPSFPLIVLSYHVIYRLYLRVYRKSFHLDCFLFVLYDKQHIHSIEAQYNRLVERQQRCLLNRSQNKLVVAANDNELRKLFANNRMFFIRARYSNRKFAYKLRSNRGMRHWLKLKRFLHQYALVCAWNFVIWSLPLATLIIFTVLSNSNFDILYRHCNQLSDQLNPNKWTWNDWKRYIWLFFDLIDSGWLLFDTANALVWPFSAMVFCAQDVRYSVDDLIVSLAKVTTRLQHWLLQGQNQTEVANLASCGSDKKRMEPRVSIGRASRQRGKLYESIQQDILVCQSEINDVMQQMCLVDEFISRLASFTIFCWIITNLYYQIMSLTANRLLLPSAVVQFMQVTAFTAISLSFAYLSNVHSKTRRLYKQICNIVAIDPSHRNKSSWLWVLEYYQEGKARYSFHLGSYEDLSLSNYLKSMSWLITGALVTISLFKQKYQHESEKLP